jgi:hypothetical protein
MRMRMRTVDHARASGRIACLHVPGSIDIGARPEWTHLIA